MVRPALIQYLELSGEMRHSRESEQLTRISSQSALADAAPNRVSGKIAHVHAQFVCPVDPLHTPLNVAVVVHAGNLVQRKQRHRSHAVLVHGIYRIPADHTSVCGIVVPPPLPHGPLQTADGISAPTSNANHLP